MSDEKTHSPANSPAVAGGKKRARRLNGRPMQIIFIAIGIILLALGMPAVYRSGREKADVAVTMAKPATAHARYLTADAGGGVIAPAPTLPVIPEKPAIPAEDKPAVGEKNVLPAPGDMPKPAKISAEAQKLRDRRFRQMEAAIDGPIKVQLEDSGAQGGRGTGTPGADDSDRRGDLSRMNQFSGEGRDWLNPAMPEAPPTTFIIRIGSVIPATLISGINSDLPGQIVGQVAQDVYDTPTGRHILIPQGARLVGEYSSEVEYGQSRVLAAWQRIIFPDGKALDIGSMPGSTGAGYAGFRDRVNNHYLRLFGSAIMMSAILAGVEMTQDDGEHADGDGQRMADALSEALGQQLGGTMEEMLGRNMNISPTLEIRPGYRLNVMLVKDLVFHGPYREFDYAGGR